MPSGLKRDLGLAETTAIAVGAMVGSGIFILPGIAYVTAGSAAVLAFVLAAILVLPAALSASEMATAMPEDGGPYLFVDRGMGPLMGTIAGVGTWMMLSLKSALALVGGVPYLVYIEPSLAELMRILSVPSQSRVLETDDTVGGLARFAEPADLLVTATENRGAVGSLLGRPGDELVDRVDCTAVMVQPENEQRSGLVQRYLLSRVFGN